MRDRSGNTAAPKLPAAPIPATVDKDERALFPEAPQPDGLGAGSAIDGEPGERRIDLLSADRGRRAQQGCGIDGTELDLLLCVDHRER